MTTEQLGRPDNVSKKRSPWLVAAIAVGSALLGLIIHNARYGAVSPRIRNPNDTGGPHPLSDPLFGYGHWIVTIEIFSYLALVSIVALVVVLWRRHPEHPYLLMTIAVSTLAWLDAPMNWVTFAAYNPDLWHWPEDWPIVSLSPTVEPLFIAAIAMFVVPPFFPAIWVLRRLQARRSSDSFVSRHPLISLSGLVFVFGFVYDFAMEALCVRIGLYTFTQVIPFGSVFVGTRWQFPLLWQSSLISILMIPAAALIYRDDTGRTVAERLARRAKILPNRPALGSFVIMLVGVNLAFMAYGLVYTAVTRWSGAATSVVCPWPWPSAKSMIRRASTSRTVHRDPSRRESGPPGRALSPTGAQWCRLRRVAVVARPFVKTSDSISTPKSGLDIIALLMDTERVDRHLRPDWPTAALRRPLRVPAHPGAGSR
ncbi:MAG: spirocyclase AveC family protein [Mycobacterium sp.]|uniref:spirocyclase AveC family protein n=1 Tax=Mycobacterium sp. TaxID=1785 RepID=UPI003F9B2E46